MLKKKLTGGYIAFQNLSRSRILNGTRGPEDFQRVPGTETTKITNKDL